MHLFNFNGIFFDDRETVAALKHPRVQLKAMGRVRNEEGRESQVNTNLQFIGWVETAKGPAGVLTPNWTRKSNGWCKMR